MVENWCPHKDGEKKEENLGQCQKSGGVIHYPRISRC
jgi:hypothetical protein